MRPPCIFSRGELSLRFPKPTSTSTPNGCLIWMPKTLSPIPQVCVPQHMAVVLTYPERVTRHNMDKLRQRVLNGRERYGYLES